MPQPCTPAARLAALAVRRLSVRCGAAPSLGGRAATGTRVGVMGLTPGLHTSAWSALQRPLSASMSWERSYARRRTTTANSKDNGGSTVAFTAEDRITDVELHSEAADSYLAYAMSVIVGRALPDVRDGLKPVHRRILYSMHELGLSSGKPFRKCARVVGEVLGKYHPHGDQAVYDSLVRMAQDFSMRQPLVNGHGNFGSLDNDPAAAMRYTECKLQPLAEAALLSDIGANTVDYTDNFDSSRQEPAVLPAVVPQLLVNGASGIAVGMSTAIPPHNLQEVVAAMCHLVDDPDADVAALRRHMPAPDFPTGGEILDQSNRELKTIYDTGRGNITLRGKAEIETTKRKSGSVREAIVISEIPYMTNKASLVERIAALVNSRELEGVSDVRDESDRDGMRVVVELKKGTNASVILNNLYKHTKLQTRVTVIMISLVNNQPKTLSLKAMLQHFIDFRVQVIERRTQFFLAKAQARDHIVQGLLLAMDNLDKLVDIIRKAADNQTAAAALTAAYGLTPTQTDAVLSISLRRLTSAEVQKLKAEHLELEATINDLTDLLATKERVLAMVKSEATAIATKYGDVRRTTVVADVTEMEEEAMVPNDDSIVTLSERGYIKRMPLSTFAEQNRGTRGKAGAKMRDNDTMMTMVQCRDHDQVLMFSETGRCYIVKAFQIPKNTRTSMGTPLRQLGVTDKILNITTLDPRTVGDDDSLVFVTSQGKIKRTALSDFKSAKRSAGLTAIKLSPGDRLQWVERTKPTDSVVVGNSGGYTIHFDLDSNLRNTGRAAMGVKAMTMSKGQTVVGVGIIDGGGMLSYGEQTDSDVEQSEEEMAIQDVVDCPVLVMVTKHGMGRRIPVKSFRLQNRGGKGLIGVKCNAGDQLHTLLVQQDSTAAEGAPNESLLLGSESGLVNRFQLNNISLFKGRSGKGVRLWKLPKGDVVSTATLTTETEDSAE